MAQPVVGVKQAFLLRPAAGRDIGGRSWICQAK